MEILLAPANRTWQLVGANAARGLPASRFFCTIGLQFRNKFFQPDAVRTLEQYGRLWRQRMLV